MLRQSTFDETRAERLGPMSDALLARLRGQEPKGAAAVYAGVPLAGFQVLCSALGTSPNVTLSGGKTDFPWLLGDVLSRRVLDLYEIARPTARLLTRRISVRDFKEHSLVLVGDYPGYFAIGDTAALTELLRQCEDDPNFLRSLIAHCDERRPRFQEACERGALAKLLGPLF